MKCVLNSCILLLMIGVILPNSLMSQDASRDTLRFSVDRNYPPLSISRAQLQEAKTIADLNQYFKPAWIKRYISVVVSGTLNGMPESFAGPDGTLTARQKRFISSVASSGEIYVQVQYIPDNTLSHNDPKDINFSFLVEPETSASYPGGESSLLDYVKTHAINKISDEGFDDETFAAVKFTIDEEGNIANVQMFQPSEDEATDDMLLEAICNMPKWHPAEYDDGTRIAQEFVLTIGNMESCLVNFLNLRR